VFFIYFYTSFSLRVVFVIEVRMTYWQIRSNNISTDGEPEGRRRPLRGGFQEQRHPACVVVAALLSNNLCNILCTS